MFEVLAHVLRIELDKVSPIQPKAGRMPANIHILASWLALIDHNNAQSFLTDFMILQNFGAKLHQFHRHAQSGPSDITADARTDSTEQDLKVTMQDVVTACRRLPDLQETPLYQSAPRPKRH